MSNKLTDFLESLPAEQRNSLPKYRIVKSRTDQYHPMIQSVIGVNAYDSMVWVRSTRLGTCPINSHQDIDVVREAIIKRYRKILDEKFPQIVEQGP